MLHCFGAMCAKTMLKGCASLIFARSIGARTMSCCGLYSPGFTSLLMTSVQRSFAGIRYTLYAPTGICVFAIVRSVCVNRTMGLSPGVHIFPDVRFAFFTVALLAYWMLFCFPSWNVQVAVESAYWPAAGI